MTNGQSSMIRVGQKLREERVRRKLTLQEVSKAIKIREQFLVAIEKGEYNKLPSSAYAQGFIKNYTQYLGLPLRQTLALFRREFDEEKFFSVLPEGLTTEEFSKKRIQIRTSLMAVILILLALGVYLLFQYRYAIINPPLDIIEPQEGETLVSQSVVISGKTDPNASVYINSKPTVLNTNGEFKEVVRVFPGKQTIVVVSVNRFNRQTREERHVEVKANGK